MSTRIAINGFGRIGRLVFRALHEQGLFGKDIEVVAVGDIVPADNLAYLLKYDSVQRKFTGNVSSKKSGTDKEADDVLVVDGKEIAVVSAKTPAELPWKQLGVEYVLECMRGEPPAPDTMYKCSCAIDAIASKVTYEEWLDLSTVSKAITIASERGGVLQRLRVRGHAGVLPRFQDGAVHHPPGRRRLRRPAGVREDARPALPVPLPVQLRPRRGRAGALQHRLGHRSTRWDSSAR